MVVHLLGYQRRPRHESESGVEVLEAKRFEDRVAPVDHRPSGELGESTRPFV
jgi:hypothetical protein